MERSDGKSELRFGLLALDNLYYSSIKISKSLKTENIVSDWLGQTKKLLRFKIFMERITLSFRKGNRIITSARTSVLDGLLFTKLELFLKKEKTSSR
jgi:hypothetical protein